MYHSLGWRTTYCPSLTLTVVTCRYAAPSLLPFCLSTRKCSSLLSAWQVARYRHFQKLLPVHRHISQQWLNLRNMTWPAYWNSCPLRPSTNCKAWSKDKAKLQSEAHNNLDFLKRQICSFVKRNQRGQLNFPNSTWSHPLWNLHGSGFHKASPPRSQQLCFGGL